MKLLELTSWTAFKALCITTKNLNCQYVQNGSLYDLYGPDANNITWHTNILIIPNPPIGSDQYDFEHNYKIQAFNFAIGNRAYAFSTSDFMFAGNGVIATIPHGAATNIDFAIPGVPGSYLYINGATVITQNATFGDWASANIVDVNNIVGYGAGAILGNYITKWYINPSQQFDINTPYAGKIPAGVFMRIVYNSVSTITNVNVAINYLLHTPL